MPGSMTGYGHAEESGYLVEIKGLNHRYKDIRVKLPRDLNQVEMQVRSYVSDAIQRGKIDVVVFRNIAETEKHGLTVNTDFAKAVFADLKKLAQEFGGEVTFKDVIAIQGVLGEEDKLADEQWELIKKPLKNAMDFFLKSKLDEGKSLCTDMDNRIQVLDDISKTIETASAEMPRIYAEKLKTNIENILQGKLQIDEVRLAQEIAIMAEKSDITEEIVRLKSHFESFRKTLKAQAASGRRLEFVLQEINREFNTIGSKSQDSAISMSVIDAKTEIEKIREQLQNIE